MQWLVQWGEVSDNPHKVCLVCYETACLLAQRKPPPSCSLDLHFISRFWVVRIVQVLSHTQSHAITTLLNDASNQKNKKQKWKNTDTHTHTHRHTQTHTHTDRQTHTHTHTHTHNVRFPFPDQEQRDRERRGRGTKREAHRTEAHVPCLLACLLAVDVGVMMNGRLGGKKFCCFGCFPLQSQRERWFDSTAFCGVAAGFSSPFTLRCLFPSSPRFGLTLLDSASFHSPLVEEVEKEGRWLVLWQGFPCTFLPIRQPLHLLLVQHWDRSV